MCECGHIRHEHDSSLAPDGTCFADTPFLTCAGGHDVAECPYPNVCHCSAFEATP
jgi:hypothetical protein